MPPILEVLETPPPLLARMILWVVMLFFVVAVIWAIIGRTDIVATASGKIIPDDRIKVVQAAEAGTIQEIRVRDGDTVKRDDVLILLDTTVTDANTRKPKKAGKKAVVEEMMAELLSSASLYIADSPPQLSDAEKYPAMSEDIFREYQKLLSGLYDEQQERLKQSFRDIEVQKAAFGHREQTSPKSDCASKTEDLIFEQRLKTENENLLRMERMLPVVMERFVASERLWAQGVVPRNDVLSVQEEKISTEQQLKYHQGRLAEIAAERKHRQSELSENLELHKNRRAELRAEIARLTQSQALLAASFRREMLDRKTEAQGRVDGLRQELIKLGSIA